MAKIEYSIENGSLTDALNLTYEIYAISGMTPNRIIHEEQNVQWDATDVRLLRGGVISENEYMRKHGNIFF